MHFVGTAWGIMKQLLRKPSTIVWWGFHFGHKVAEPYRLSRNNSIRLPIFISLTMLALMRLWEFYYNALVLEANKRCHYIDVIGIVFVARQSQHVSWYLYAVVGRGLSGEYSLRGNLSKAKYLSFIGMAAEAWRNWHRHSKWVKK